VVFGCWLHIVHLKVSGSQALMVWTTWTFQRSYREGGKYYILYNYIRCC
jgi:hypothetical protein